MSVILRLGAVSTDMPYSRLTAEEPEHEKPMDVSSGSEEAYNLPPQTYPGCFGLPYQDHNYGAPPPPTPPQTPPIITPTVKESVEVKEEIIVTSDVPCPPAQPTSIQIADQDVVDDPTRCICDFVHDDGYMIQCDKCSVWQHIVCMGLDRDSIPDVYFCEQCHPRPVDRVRAREFQIRKREFLKTLVIKSHDSSTDTDPEEVNNRLKAYGLDAQGGRHKQKMKLKKRKERNNSKTGKRLKIKDMKTEKENTSNDANRKSKLLVKDCVARNAQLKKEKLSKKIEKMRAERLSKETREDRFSSDDLREDEKIISTMNNIPTPLVQDENAQNPWDMNTFNEWEQSYETARYNQYTTYVQEYLNSTCTNGHHNDIADLVTDGLRVQRCRVKALKNKRKGLESTSVIPNGQPVIEVIGKVMTRQQYDKDNFGQRQLSPFVFFYGTVFDLDLVIDASDYGNDARFIRRSCQPNAAVHHVVAGGQAHFIAVATKEITENLEITIPFDYDYKKWNYCVECACLRNNCPVTRFQKRRLRFQKLQQQHQHSSSPGKKFHKHEKIEKLKIHSPVKSPTRSPVRSPVKSPEKSGASTPTPETIHVSPPPMPSPAKMVRRSQVSRQNSTNASTQASSGRVRSLRVPSQTGDDSVKEPVTAPEPTQLRSTESTDHLTSPDSHSDSARDNGNSSDTPKQEEKRKLTREERKMEAIMRAFEKMEKRNARKASQDQTRKGSTDQPRPEHKEQEVGKEKEEKELKSKKEKQKNEDIPQGTEKEETVKEEPKVEEVVGCPESVVSTAKAETCKEETEVIVDTKREEALEVKEERTGPNLRERDRPPPPPKTKKAKRSSGRRRVRNASGAAASSGTSSMDLMSESTEDNSNGATPQAVSCPVTPAVQADSEDTPPAFRFLKTKRHLMNEWLSEKDSRLGSKQEPLEVSVEDNMFVTCLPSPRNSMDRLRRNSASAAHRERSSSQHSESAGSAKKRWLRQAMGDGSSETSSGMASPVLAHGPTGVSTSPQAMPSPGASPPIDFVTPLKKRRLARESLLKESGTEDTPSQTPVPMETPIGHLSSSYFASLNESFESLQSKNGLSAFFSPLKQSDMDIEKKSKSLMDESPGMSTCDTSSFDQLNVNCEAQSNAREEMEEDETEDGLEETVAASVDIEDRKDGVSSCADIDCTVSGNTGTVVCQKSTDEMISNTEVKSSSEVEDCCTTQDEQINVCDHNKSANSEPDSSDSVCRSSDNIQKNVECDSVSASTRSVCQAEVGGEVDSTETDTASQVTENTQCDSCNSEQTASSRAVAGPSNIVDKVCTSTTLSASVSTLKNSCVSDCSYSNRNNLDRISQVDSSTDEPHGGTSSVSGSHVDSAVTSNSNAGLLFDRGRDSSAQSLLSLDNEVSNSFGLDSLHNNINRNTVGSATYGDPFSVSSNSASDLVPIQNRHLKFLNDSSYSADTTVDSTSQYMTPVGVSSMGNPSALMGYDSDSMDVTSASEAMLDVGMEDSRRCSEDSLSGFLEPMSSSGSDLSQQPKEKKKVSLQEYLKRKKDKPSTSGSGMCSSSATSPSAVPLSNCPLPTKSRVTVGEKTSPLKLSNPISLKELDKKLPPLPSLPSLPMFEKTERKEFKSSSDLLSPIFNREKKQEEVRKPMSLSERLRHEFGLDDSTDETETESKNEHSSRGSVPNGDKSEVPPPPPPPPQSQLSKTAKMTNGNNSQHTPKGFSSPLLKPVEGATPSSTAPQMVPPHATGIGLNLTGSLGALPSIMTGTKASTPLAPGPSGPLNNLLSNVKNPQQLQNDLAAQLNAIKAQISKVQKALPTQPVGTDQPVTGAIPPVNGLPSASNMIAQGFDPALGKPQVFDYGHQSNKQFLRQNSQPVNSSKAFHSYKKQTSSSPSFSRLSPRLKASPTGMNHSFSNVQPQNGAGNQGYNNHVSPSWSQKHTNINHLSNRKPYSKQNAKQF